MQISISEMFKPRLMGGIVAATLVSGAIAYYGIATLMPVSKTETSQSTQLPETQVMALGRLEPESEVIQLAAPIALETERIAELLVKSGDRVRVGQVIAILDARDRLQRNLIEAQEQIDVAKAELAQVKAGAKFGELAAQTAEINRYQAQMQGDETIQIATIQRIQAQWEGERSTQEATLSRLAAQWEGERAAQEATLGRLSAELNNAEAEYQRYLQLHEEGAISESFFEGKRLSVETSRQQLLEGKANLERIDRTAREQIAEAESNLERINRTFSQQVTEAEVTLGQTQRTGSQQVLQAQSELDSLAEVRSVDVEVAQRRLDRAIATAEMAAAELEQVYIRAPIAGKILKIHAHPGEKLDSKGVVELAQTDRMVAIAEVYQTDIHKVRIGQGAIITSQAFSGELAGTVIQIDSQVIRQAIASGQPGENLDRRVVEVKVQLTPEASKQVANLTNLQVEVAIDIARKQP